MKTLLNKLLKCRITRWGFLAVLLIAAGATVAAMNQKHPQLGGGFIGNNGAGNVWNALQIPLDPAGRTAAVRVNMTAYNAEFAGLLAALGADTVTEFVGELAMISRDTAKYGSVAYANQQGNPPQRRAILVMNGKLHFTGPDSFTVNYTIDVYPVNVPDTSPFYGLPNADANADGYPDKGTLPVLSIPGLDYASRVPIP